MPEKQTNHSGPGIKSLEGWHDTPRLRVLIVNDNPIALDSLEQWLRWTQKVEIVGKLSATTSTLEAWKLTRPQIIILSIPQEDAASTASAETAQAIKALYPGTRIIILAGNLSGASQEVSRLFPKIADAWIFVEDILYELLPAFAMLFPENSHLNKRERYLNSSGHSSIQVKIQG